MEFRIAREKDLERMCEITAQAKAGLKNLGLDQWQKRISIERNLGE